MNTPQLTIRQLTIAYRSGGQLVRPVDRLDLDVVPGELVLLHGPSGCGKTTLLSAIAGLLPPESGSIRIGDVDVARLRGRAMLAHRRTTVGVVFQNFNLVPSLTAEENVAVPLRLAGHGPRGADDRPRTPDAIRDGAAPRPPARQPFRRPAARVALARALASDPPILLADEPTAHLDHTQVDIVRSTLRSIADAGRIVVIATHDDRLNPSADRIVSLVAPPPTPGLDLVTSVAGDLAMAGA